MVCEHARGGTCGGGIDRRQPEGGLESSHDLGESDAVMQHLLGDQHRVQIAVFHAQPNTRRRTGTPGRVWGLNARW